MKRTGTKRRKHTKRQLRPVKGIPKPTRKQYSRTRRGF
jgi:hypothetical protein